MAEIIASYVPSKTAHLNPIVDSDSLIFRAGWVGIERDSEGNPAPSPLSHSLSNLKTTVTNILDRFPNREWEKLYLTAPGGYRHKVATLRPYKGTRTAKKPEHYEAMRKYLVEYWGAEVVDEDIPEDERREADDAVCSLQWSHPNKTTCIVGLDKDLKQCPGWHYHPTKDTFECRTLLDADIFFWRQCLTGDTCDNIGGLKGVGDKTADKIIEGCLRKRNRIRRAVEDGYKREFSGKWFEALNEVATLVFMQRDPGQTWQHYHWNQK